MLGGKKKVLCSLKAEKVQTPSLSMAKQGYPTGGYTTYNWTSRPPPYGWSNSTNDRDGHLDDVRHPVIIEAEVRQRPVVTITPLEGYVTTIVEEVRTHPFITEYKFSSPEMVETLVRDHGSTDRKWDRSSSPVRDHLKTVHDFISQIQTEASSQSPRHGPSRTTYLQYNSAPDFTTHHSTTGYGEHEDHRDRDYSSYDSYKPSNHVGKDQGSKDYYQHSADPKKTPITTRQWGKQDQGTSLRNITNDYKKSLEDLIEPASKTSPVPTTTTTTTDIPRSQFAATVPRRSQETINSEEARRRSLEYLIEPASKTSPVPTTTTTATEPIPRARFTVTVPRRSQETINSEEARRQYANFNTSSRPMPRGSEAYKTIDSREAARKYNGVIL